MYVYIYIYICIYLFEYIYIYNEELMINWCIYHFRVTWRESERRCQTNKHVGF